MTFAVAFTLVSNEQEDTYKWFLETLKQQINMPSSTVFVTDKCNAQFPGNKQLLCTWHMQNNLDDHCKPSPFKQDGKHFVDKFKSYVSTLINYKDGAIEVETSKKVADFLNDKSIFASEAAQLKFKNYYENEWLRCEQKWKAAYSCDVSHFGNTTTQRAESGHAALKAEMNQHQALQLSFFRIAASMESFERKYNTRLTHEQNTAVVSTLNEAVLRPLVGKISHKALKQLKVELGKTSSPEDDCSCEASRNYNLPCCHQLAVLKLQKRRLDLDDIPHRWWLGESKETLRIMDEKDPVIKLLDPKHYMKYVYALEAAFERCEGDSDKTKELQEGILNLLGLDENLELIPEETPSLKLPSSTQVKSPGRKKKIPRKSALKKDYANAGFRQRYFDSKQKDVVNADPKFKVEFVPVAASEVPEAKVEQKRKADEELSLPIKASKSNENLSIPRKRLVEDFESIASHARSAAAASSSSHLIHKSIRQEDVKEIRSPRADGFRGFRAAAHSLIGESSYPVVKQKMLQALEKYHGRYISELQITANELEAAKQTITCGIDRSVADVQKADKRALETCDALEQGESKEAFRKMLLNDSTMDEHRHAVCARTTYWFQDFDCGQILADAFAVPVCIYPSEDNQKPFTFLPLDLPKNRKIKPNPIHLQHTPFHWISLRFTATHSDLPAIFYTEHWNKKANFAMYRDYWNKWKQFPKRIEPFFGEKEPISQTQQIASVIDLC